MNKAFVLAAWCAVAILALPLFQCRSRERDFVLVMGSTTLAPVIRSAADLHWAKKPGMYRVESQGSHSGILSLLEGRCDIAGSSVPITDMEMDIARARGVEIREYVIAHDMIVPIVNPANPVVNLGLDTLRGIYNGSIRNWKDTGGADLPVKLVARDFKSGTKDVWRRLVTQSEGVEGVIEKPSGSAVIAEVAHDAGAIGYVSFSSISNRVKAMKVDGIAPTIENGIKGTYRMKRPLYLYVDGKKVSPEARNFIVFLTGREGQRIIRQGGLIPLPGGE
ncbi:MAG TPA: PstS family phosphate ABC transporter substrate-binding protein [Spirochaetota bacterium]|nr:PstS family phosphate ABC transporter substrate-binding protein [Spirochaetota bacterium]